MTTAYDSLHPQDSARFENSQKQSLDEWFSLSDLPDYSKNNGRLLTARDEAGGLVGVAYIGKENPLSWPDGYKVKLFLLAVHPKSRGQGIGQNLIRESEKVAREMGAKMIIIDTHVFMEADQRLYRDKMGYKEMGVLKDYYGNGDAIFFGKPLI